MNNSTDQKTSDRLTRELLETASDMHTHGLMDDATFGKITKRIGGRPVRPQSRR